MGHWKKNFSLTFHENYYISFKKIFDYGACKSTISNKHRDIAKAGNIMKSRTGEGVAIFTGNKIGSPGVEGVGGRKRL